MKTIPATPANVARILRSYRFPQAAGDRDGFTVKWMCGGQTAVIVAHQPPNSQTAAAYRKVLAGYWRASQIGTYYVVVYVKEDKK